MERPKMYRIILPGKVIEPLTRDCAETMLHVKYKGEGIYTDIGVPVKGKTND